MGPMPKVGNRNRPDLQGRGPAVKRAMLIGLTPVTGEFGARL